MNTEGQISAALPTAEEEIIPLVRSNGVIPYLTSQLILPNVNNEIVIDYESSTDTIRDDATVPPPSPSENIDDISGRSSPDDFHYMVSSIPQNSVLIHHNGGVYECFAFSIRGNPEISLAGSSSDDFSSYESDSDGSI